MNQHAHLFGFFRLLCSDLLLEQDTCQAPTFKKYYKNYSIIEAGVNTNNVCIFFKLMKWYKLQKNAKIVKKISTFFLFTVSVAKK